MSSIEMPEGSEASGRVMELLRWCHVFERKSDKDYAQALLSGPMINPKSCKTHANEDVLALQRSVYAYLGVPLEDFGDAGLVVALGTLSGELSPFDTGGLVDHHDPVKDWSVRRKQAYLKEHTYSSAQLSGLLASYPGLSKAEMLKYLRHERPHQMGPHEVWPPADSTLEAEIWNNGDDPRSWLWELRVPRRLPVAGRVLQWTCAPTRYKGIREQLERVSGSREVRARDLLSRYVKGGLAALIESLLASSEEAA